MPEDLDLTRRDFMVAGSTSLLAIQSGGMEVDTQGTRVGDHDFLGVADLVGPAAAKPPANDEFFEHRIAFAYRYEATDTGRRYFITENYDNWMDISMPLEDYSTPFQAVKTAAQETQFALDPSKDLTRRRYAWHSNNALFDATYLSNNDANGTITLDTGGSSANTARIRSAIAGQYVSQTLAQPGIGLDIAPSNVSIDSDNLASLSHGTVALGAGWHDGSSGGWGVGGPVQTFIGLKMDSGGVEAHLISNGSHIGDSPVPQSEWNLDPMDGTGPSGEVLRPQDGYIYNMPYTWYAFGALFVGIIHPETDQPIFFHRFTVDNASFDRPNLPTLLVVDDNGVASSLRTELGGMQYALYGAQLSGEGGEERATEASRTDYSVGTQAVTNNNSIDPVAEPGTPVVAIQRQGGVRDLSLRIDGIQANTDAPIYLFSWDEYDPATALSGANFRDPNETVTPSSESKIKLDTAATDYTLTTAVSRGVDYLNTQKNQESFQTLPTDDRIPIDATRVITAVHDGASATVDPAQVRVVEGY